MMKAERMAERLPDFYRAWDKRSVIFKLLFAVADRLEESEGDQFRILRAHWVDTAYSRDLDYIGAIFNIERKPGERDLEYRRRLKAAIHEFRGGGTVPALLASVRTFLGLRGDEMLELIENPPTSLYFEYVAKTGDTWSLGSRSIHDATPAISIIVDVGQQGVLNPTITNLDTGESVKLEGVIKGGQRLILKEGVAELDGVDVGAKVSGKVPPKLYRRVSKWEFQELFAMRIGVFDSSVFNEGVFALPIPTATIRYEWVSYLPAAFELKVPHGALARSGLTKEAVQEFVNTIKAEGVRGMVAVAD